METYRKIYIKSEADLPKVAGSFIVHTKQGDTFNDYSYPFLDNIPMSKSSWLKYIDWYLQPVEAELSS